MKQEKFYRNCPKCSKTISYTNKKNRNVAEKKQRVCFSCVYEINNEKNRHLIQKYLTDKEVLNKEIEKIFNENKAKVAFRKKVNEYLSLENTKKILKTRICPSCKKEVISMSVQTRKKLEGRQCKECYEKEMSVRGKLLTGSKNPFFRKNHSLETLNKIKESRHKSEKWSNHLNNIRTEEYRKKISEQFSGEKNPAFKRGTLESIWTEKYGEEEAKKRQESWKSKLRLKSVGENNNMFGKPSPIGSGNGWSGWYKGWYFRSLRELSYMINEIEANLLNWESGELKKYKITYIDWKGCKRNYFSDFILNGKTMVECKPLSLQNSKDVVSKKEAAEKFCKDNNMKYIVVDPKMLEDVKIKELYNLGVIKFLPRYEEKFLKKYY